MGPDQMLPSLPMTGPTNASGPKPAARRLEGQPAKPDGMGMGMGKMMKMSPEAEMAQQMADDYVVPARPSTLRMEAETPTQAIRLSQRRLPTMTGPRRL